MAPSLAPSGARGERRARSAQPAARDAAPRCDLRPCRTTHADLVLTGGRIFTADAAKTWAQALAVRDGRIVAVGGGPRRPSAGRARRRASSSCAAGPSPRASATPRPPAVTAGSSGIQCDLNERPRPRRVPEVIAEYAAAHPDRGVDRRRRLVAGRLPGRRPAPRGPRPGRPGSPGVPPQPRRPRRVGQHRGARARRDHDGHRRPRRRPDRPGRGRHAASARSTRARWTSSATWCRPRPRPTSAARSSRASATSTASGSRTGRTPGSLPPTEAVVPRRSASRAS